MAPFQGALLMRLFSWPGRNSESIIIFLYIEELIILFTPTKLHTCIPL